MAEIVCLPVIRSEICCVASLGTFCSAVTALFFFAQISTFLSNISTQRKKVQRKKVRHAAYNSAKELDTLRTVALLTSRQEMGNYMVANDDKKPSGWLKPFTIRT